LRKKALTPPTRARAERSKIVEGTLPGTDVLRGEVWRQVENLAALYTQLFERPCFVTENVVKAVGPWLKRHNLPDGRRLLYLRASVPAWNSAAGREERWSKGSIQSLFDERAFFAGKQKEPLYDNLMGRFSGLPTRVKEIVDGNGDTGIFEATGGNGQAQRPTGTGVGEAPEKVPFRPFLAD